MRFSFNFTLKNQNLPTEYRQAFLSYFKKALTDYENGIYFENFYEKGITKDFCFAVRLSKAIFEGEKILLAKPELQLLLSSDDARTALILFNSLFLQKGQAFPLAFENTMTLISARVENQQIIHQPVISAKLAMPLCVRYHQREKNTDFYYAYDRDGFQMALKEVVRQQVLTSGLFNESVLEEFSFRPIQMKKTVIKHQGQQIEASLGIFQMSGNIQLLNYLYANGAGSRRSSGFGYFDILAQGKEES